MRHSWIYEAGSLAGRSSKVIRENARTKTCKKCRIRADRFGNGRDSYWTFAKPGQDITWGDGTPPCES